MSFNEFRAWAAENIKDYLPAPYSDAPVDVRKIAKSGCTYTGLNVMPEGCNTCATVDLDMFYEVYLGGADSEYLLQTMSEVVQLPHPPLDVDWLSEYGNVRDRLFVRLINAEDNRDALAGAPYKQFADLALTYYVMVDRHSDCVGSTMVRDNMLESYGVSPEQLHADALASSAVLLPAKISRLSDEINRARHCAGEERGDTPAECQETANGLMPETCPDTANGPVPAACPDDGTPASRMLLISNSKNFFGAAALFYDGLMEFIEGVIGGSYYVLPSSVNELILLPDDGETDPECLAALVRDVNRSVVRPDEWLSDNVYYYDAQTKQFRKA
ncbi:MAG: hypothetical protein IKR08_02690 [Firmicutes bacterium]|nr:hypothetical protein [Bacillota bacterium]